MMRGIKFRFLLFAAGMLFAFASCGSSPDVYIPIDNDVKTGSYEKALASIDNKKGKARRSVYTSKNQILLYLDRGMINHYAGYYEDSSRDLENAERLIEEAFTRSISQEIGSYILNDNTKEYSGEDYEDLYINVFNSLNYYHSGNLEGALVEIRRLNEKLVFLADKYERAKRKVLDSNTKIDPGTLPMEAAKFSNSALARYLGMLFYRGTGRDDSARIDHEELIRAYELAPWIYTNSIPASVDEERAVPDGMGRLNVIAFTGLSPVKVEQNLPIPLPLPSPNNWARLALPVMVSRPQTVQWAEAVLDTGQRFRLELLEDMGAVARETFKSRYGLIVLKTVARTIAKAATSATAAHVAGQSNEGLGALVGLVGLIFTAASENADTRLSRYFPSNALVGAVNLEPGYYNVTVNFYGSGGLVYSERKEVSVRERGLNLEEFICLK